MKDCNKLKFKAVIGVILFFLMYSTKSFLKGGTYSGIIEFLIAIIVLLIMIITFVLVFPYLKCLSENNKKFR